MTATVVLTRPDGRNDVLARDLHARGLTPLILPALVVRNLCPCVPSLPHPGDYDLLVFVSGHAARFYLDELKRRTPGFIWPARSVAAAVGTATAAALADYAELSDTAVTHPAPEAGQDSEGLWQLLAPKAPQWERALIVRAGTGRDWLSQRLTQCGIDVQRFAAYSREPAMWSPGQIAGLDHALAAPQPCVFVLTSSESVDAVHENLRLAGLDWNRPHVRFVAIHARVASRLQSVLTSQPLAGRCDTGQSPRIELCQPSDASILEAVVRAASR